jgi:hypothetical protein
MRIMILPMEVNEMFLKNNHLIQLKIQKYKDE